MKVSSEGAAGSSTSMPPSRTPRSEGVDRRLPECQEAEPPVERLEPGRHRSVTSFRRFRPVRICFGSAGLVLPEDQGHDHAEQDDRREDLEQRRDPVQL
jgi:hypothetical protein